MDLIDFDNINNLNIKDNYSFTIHRNFSDLDEIHFLPKFDSIVFKGDISLTFIEKFSSNEKVYGKSERISELTFEENKFSKNYPKNFHIFNQDFDFLKIKDFSVNSDAENIKNLLIAILLTNNKIKIYECNQIANYRSWPNLENSDIWGFSLTWIPSICSNLFENKKILAVCTKNFEITIFQIKPSFEILGKFEISQNPETKECFIQKMKWDEDNILVASMTNGTTHVFKITIEKNKKLKFIPNLVYKTDPNSILDNVLKINTTNFGENKNILITRNRQHDFIKILQDQNFEVKSVKFKTASKIKTVSMLKQDDKYLSILNLANSPNFLCFDETRFSLSEKDKNFELFQNLFSSTLRRISAIDRPNLKCDNISVSSVCPCGLTILSILTNIEGQTITKTSGSVKALAYFYPISIDPDFVLLKIRQSLRDLKFVHLQCVKICFLYARELLLANFGKYLERLCAVFAKNENGFQEFCEKIENFDDDSTISLLIISFLVDEMSGQKEAEKSAENKKNINDDFKLYRQKSFKTLFYRSFKDAFRNIEINGEQIYLKKLINIFPDFKNKYGEIGDSKLNCQFCDADLFADEKDYFKFKCGNGHFFDLCMWTLKPIEALKAVSQCPICGWLNERPEKNNCRFCRIKMNTF